jgi:hypothetical protein
VKYDILVAPAHSSIVVTGRVNGMDVPPQGRGLPNVVATSTCITCGTLIAQDGETRIEFSDEIDALLPDEPPAFDGVLETPDGRVSVWSAVLKRLFPDITVHDKQTRVRIWTNSPSEPDDIRIVVSPVQGKPLAERN